MNITTKQAAVKLKVTPRRVRVLCEQGRVVGAFKNGRGDWEIPSPPVVLEAPANPRTGKIKTRKVRG